MLYIVSGVMRSGTSMMMESLIAGGLDAVYIPRGGCYELATTDLYAPDFPRAFDGKLIKVLDFALSHMVTMPNGIRIVAMRRPLEDIQSSMMRFLGNRDKELREAVVTLPAKIAALRHREDVLSLDEFWYDDVVQDPLAHFTLLQEHGWEINPVKCAQIPQPTVR